MKFNVKDEHAIGEVYSKCPNCEQYMAESKEVIVDMGVNNFYEGLIRQAYACCYLLFECVCGASWAVLYNNRIRV